MGGSVMKSRELDDKSEPSDRSKISGRGSRLGVNLGALLAGAVAAILLFPGAAPWMVWSQTNAKVPAPIIVGLLVAALALLVARPWRLAGDGR
jgi:hypothetical protein